MASLGASNARSFLGDVCGTGRNDTLRGGGDKAAFAHSAAGPTREPNLTDAAERMNDRLSMLSPDQPVCLPLEKNNRAYDRSSGQCAEPCQLIAEDAGPD